MRLASALLGRMAFQGLVAFPVSVALAAFLILAVFVVGSAGDRASLDREMLIGALQLYLFIAYGVAIVAAVPAAFFLLLASLAGCHRPSWYGLGGFLAGIAPQGYAALRDLPSLREGACPDCFTGADALFMACTGAIGIIAGLCFWWIARRSFPLAHERSLLGLLRRAALAPFRGRQG